MHVVIEGFTGRRARLLEGAGGTELGTFELARRRAEAAATLGDRQLRIVAHPDRRHHWYVVEGERPAGGAQQVGDALVIERPSVLRREVVLVCVDGRRLVVTPRGVFRRRFEVHDAGSGVTVARLTQATAFLRSSWDLEDDGLSDAERVACVWVAVTTSRSDAAAGAAAAGGAAAAAGS